MLKKKYILNQGFITQKIDNKLAIFSGEESLLFTLNETAAFIFQGLKLGWSEEEIISKMTDKFDIGKKVVIQDLNRFIKLLLKKEILVKK